jgi:hypothetical protein
MRPCPADRRMSATFPAHVQQSLGTHPAPAQHVSATCLASAPHISSRPAGLSAFRRGSWTCPRRIPMHVRQSELPRCAAQGLDACTSTEPGHGSGAPWEHTGTSGFITSADHVKIGHGHQRAGQRATSRAWAGGWSRPPYLVQLVRLPPIHRCVAAHRHPSQLPVGNHVSCDSILLLPHLTTACLQSIVVQKFSLAFPIAGPRLVANSSQ